MVTMREDGFYKAARGITTLEEILRVVFYSDSDMAYPQDADLIVRLIDGEEVEFERPKEKTPSMPAAPDCTLSQQEIQLPSTEIPPSQTSFPSQPPHPAQSLHPYQSPRVTYPSQPTQLAHSYQTMPSPQLATEASFPTIGTEEMLKMGPLENPLSQESLQGKNKKDHGEKYRIRFEADTITLEQDRIQKFFQYYLSLKNEFGEKISEDLLADFIDFIVYYTTLSQKKYGAVFVEFYLKVIDESPKIFLQFQGYNLRESSPYTQKIRGQRLMEFLT